MGILYIQGIRCHAYHGCLKEESKIGAEYVVDVWIKADLLKAASSDKLEHTIDYGLVHGIAIREMKKPSKLIEHVCQRIVAALKKELLLAQQVKVKVTKINPPINGDVKQVSIILQG